jgi:hypothetical protein
MSEAAANRLEELVKLLVFVPVTTRTLTQFNRLLLFKKRIPDYVIVSNGDIILRKGGIDGLWQKKILSKLAASCVSVPEIMEKFKKMLYGAWIPAAKQVDGFFFYFLVYVEQLTHQQLSGFSRSAKDWGWGIFLIGRKLYLAKLQ